MHDIWAGLNLVVGLLPIGLIILGVLVGFVVGVLPGFGSTQACALLLPFSLTLGSVHLGLILMISIYCGTYYAGAVPAILLNIPGEAGAAATALDGYAMTRQGKGNLAIGIARFASVFGGVVGGAIVLFSLDWLSAAALIFGSREMFLVALLALIISSAVMGADVLRGLTSALLGLLIGAMSASTLTAQSRFAMGFPQLYQGVPFVPAIIGLMAMSEMFLLARRDTVVNEDAPSAGRTPSIWQDAVESITVTFSHFAVLIRSSLLGTALGLIPGVGAGTAQFVSYGLARRSSKHPERFGKGTPEGVIASESADNASITAHLVPTLTLGIPGSGTTAVMLGALYLHSIQPGPRLMLEHGDIAFAIIWSSIFASLLIFPLGILAGGLLVRISYMKTAAIIPTILLLCTLGNLALRNDVFDVGLAFVFGLLGIALRYANYPVVPVVLGLLLGPLVESNLIRALAIGQGDFRYLFGSNTAITLWVLLFAVTAYTVVREVRARRREAMLVGEDA